VTEHPRALRARFAAGEVLATTAGLASGFVQANLVVLPRDVAEPFLAWCRSNPKPCPVLAVGGRAIPELGVGDVARELPRYRVWRDGEIADTPADVQKVWREDLVSVALGCSYSFDAALEAAGVRLRHVEQGINPPIYETALETAPVEPFGGKLIVAMRPLSPADAARAVAVTAPHVLAHGAPVHLGNPRAIGVDQEAPLNGSMLRPGPGEIGAFWACGVTPESALRRAKLPFAITHFPGAMLITDLRLDQPSMHAAA
jgi:uncharacterized protein YcsI (UPF0317 family)